MGDQRGRDKNPFSPLVLSEEEEDDDDGDTLSLVELAVPKAITPLPPAQPPPPPPERPISMRPPPQRPIKSSPPPDRPEVLSTDYSFSIFVGVAVTSVVVGILKSILCLISPPHPVMSMRIVPFHERGYILTVGSRPPEMPPCPTRQAPPRCAFFGRCFTCRYPGHSQKWCPLRFCTRCSDYGHIEMVCPFRIT